MDFEIYNLIKFGLFTVFLVVAFVYYKKKGAIKTGYKPLVIMWVVFFMLSFKGFYTLHEAVDIQVVADDLLTPTGVPNSALDLNEYLSTQPIEDTISLEDELELQTIKSEELRKEIEGK